MIYKKSWKYILVKDDNTTLCNRYPYFYRLKSLKNFSDISISDIGGYVQGYYNLSQSGNCWIYDDALIRDDAKISENARIYEYARVYDGAKVYGNAVVKDRAHICGCARVYGNARITNDARVYGYNQICGNTII